MITVVFMMVSTYLVPLSVTVATTHDLSEITDGTMRPNRLTAVY